MNAKVKVLFVCLGNICRSPTAEGVFSHLVNTQRLKKQSLRQQIEVDSAGTSAYHVGQAPDLRSQAAARQRGIEIGHQRSRQMTVADYGDYDYILAMDQQNLADLQQQCPEQFQHKLQLIMDFAANSNERSVPDPYYREDGFGQVLDMVEEGAKGLLQKIMLRAGKPNQ